MEIPHRCPVCNGQGLVQNGFYRAIGVDSYTSSDATPEQCKSCQGTGIVWNCEYEVHDDNPTPGTAG